MKQNDIEIKKNADDQTVLRRRPIQRRSRERVERMLSAAVTLIERDGSDGMRMSDVAEMAGVSIGSLYQYFPDKSAIIRSLAERCLIEGRGCIESELAAVKSKKQLHAAWSRLIDSYYEMFLTEPAKRDIWCATQGDCRLRKVELEDSRINAGVLAETLARLRPNADRSRFEASALLIMHLCDATMRLAISVGPAEGATLVEAYKRMTLYMLKTELEPN